MNQNEEKFFGELTSTRADADEEYQVELAKADTFATKPRMTAVANDSAWPAGEPEGQLTVDVYQTPDAIMVESAIAGVKPEDIDVNVTADSLVIRGARRREKTVSNEDYIYQECYWGSFGRSIILPQEVDPESAEVKFKNGILTVRLPKVDKKKSKKLKVKAE